MDTRNSLITFILLVLLFACTFIFSVDALGTPNALYGVVAIIGFIVCIGMSLFSSILAAQNGEGIAIWLRVYAVVISIVFIWFLTRCGTAFGLW